MPSSCYVWFTGSFVLQAEVMKINASSFLSDQNGCCCLGKSVNSGEKTALNQTKPASVQIKPFAGKVFYLDLPSNKTAETLESDIKELGGVRQKHIASY